MIVTENLSKRFDDYLAVDGISLNVDRGQVLVLLGPNGAGKTTTVRMLSSVLKPTGGSAKVAGYDVVGEAQQVRARVGVLTENHGLYGRMNADEYLQFFGRLYSLDDRTIHDRSDHYLEEFGLTAARKRRLGEYSKGMRQKLALTRCLLHNPDVLLLDEPTSAMDPESARSVREAIRAQQEAGRTVVLCTHNLAEAEGLADQVAIIRLGKMIFQGAKEELIHRLVGPVQYELRYSGDLGGWLPELPAGVVLIERGDGWLRFLVPDPERCNPPLLRQMVEHSIEVISFQEMPQNLEQAYLQAMSVSFQMEVENA